LNRSEPPHANIDRTRAWLRSMINSPANGVTDFIITVSPSHTPIGKIGVWQGEEIGFLIARPYWGKGLAKEALQLILNHLFSDKDFQVIVADCDPRNAASIGVLKKMGFEQYDFKEKSFEINGEWVDSMYLSLDKARWEKT
jgi:[ribosomal protein S5]-alanine N-acetyltransferase